MAAPVTRGGMRQVWLKFRCFATSNIGFGKFGLAFGVQGNIFLLTFWEQGTIGGYPVRPPSGSDGRCFLWGGLELRWETPLQLCQHRRVQADTDTMQLKLGDAKTARFFPIELGEGTGFQIQPWKRRGDLLVTGMCHVQVSQMKMPETWGFWDHWARKSMMPLEYTSPTEGGTRKIASPSGWARHEGNLESMDLYLNKPA